MTAQTEWERLKDAAWEAALAAQREAWEAARVSAEAHRAARAAWKAAFAAAEVIER